MNKLKFVYHKSLWALMARPWLMAIMFIAFTPNADAMGCGTVNTGVFSSFTGLLGSVASFLNGGFGRAAVIIAIAIMGLFMMFGELKGIFGTGIKILMGGSLVLMAAQWAGIFSSFGGTTTTCNFINNGGGL